MVSETLHLVERISLESFRLCHFIISYIQPEVVPYHQTILVAIVVEFIIGDTSCPKTDHIIVQILMKADFLFIIFILAAEKIFAHTPVATLHEHTLSVDIELKNGHTYRVGLILIVVFLDTIVDLLLLKHLIAIFHLEGDCVKVGISITVRPPEKRILNHKLREAVGTHLNGCGGIGIDHIIFAHHDIAGVDCSLDCDFLRLVATVFEI